MFATMFLGVVLGVFLTLGWCGGTRSADCSSRCSSVRGRGRCCSAASSRPRPSAPSTSPASTPRDAGNRADRPLVARPDRAPGARARSRRLHRRCDLAARLGVPLCDGQRDRRLHGLRFGARSPVCSARSARPSTPGRSRRRPASSPGRSPSRRSTRTGSMRSPKTPPSPASSSGSAPSAPRTPPARGSAPGSPFTRSAFVRSR